MAGRNGASRGTWPLSFVALTTYVGAAIYFIGHSNGSFWGVILGLLEAIVWPVFVIYHVLEVLHV
jgi:hypothetical protein